MRSVLQRSLRDLVGATFGWTLIVTAASCVMLYFFPAIQQFPHLTELFKALPPALQALAGGPEILASATGFLKLKVMENLPLIFSIFTIMHAAAAIAGEEERGTLELLLAHPVPRWKVAVGKFVALALAVLLMGTCVAAGLWLTVRFMALRASTEWIFASALGAALVAVLFGALAFWASCGLRHGRTAAVIAGPVLGVAYLLHLLAPLSASLERWARLSPVHQYLRQVPWSGTVPPSIGIEPLVLSLAVLGLALLAFQRRDVGG